MFYKFLKEKRIQYEKYVCRVIFIFSRYLSENYVFTVMIIGRKKKQVTKPFES